MNEKLWWYIARSTGIVAWALVAASVIWGLLLTTRLLGGRPAPKWLLDLHRYLGGLAVTFTALHLAGLVADSYSHFGPADILVPFASAWKPLPVALGVVGMYLLLAVEGTSLMMRRIPRKWWRWIHLASFGSFWLATIHGVTAGTDSTNPLMVLAYLLVGGLVLFLTFVRVLADKRRPRPDRPQSSRGGPDPHPGIVDPGREVDVRTQRDPKAVALLQRVGRRHRDGEVEDRRRLLVRGRDRDGEWTGGGVGATKGRRQHHRT